MRRFQVDQVVKYQNKTAIVQIVKNKMCLIQFIDDGSEKWIFSRSLKYAKNE